MIAIRNGVVRLVKQHISLEVDLFGRVTLEKDVAITPSDALDISAAEHNFEDRRPNNRRDDRREGDRPRNNNYNRNREPRREGEDRPRRNYNNNDRAERQGGYRREDRGDRREDREPRQQREQRDYRQPRENR